MRVVAIDAGVVLIKMSLMEEPALAVLQGGQAVAFEAEIHLIAGKTIYLRVESICLSQNGPVVGAVGPCRARAPCCFGYIAVVAVGTIYQAAGPVQRDVRF